MLIVFTIDVPYIVLSNTQTSFLSQYFKTAKLSFERLNNVPKLVYLQHVQYRETLAKLCNQ